MPPFLNPAAPPAANLPPFLPVKIKINQASLDQIAGKSNQSQNLPAAPAAPPAANAPPILPNLNLKNL